MSETEANRPLRVFEKILGGELGAGNIGVISSRHGTGKIAILTSIAIDKAMDERNVLLVTLNRSVQDVRAYRDEVLDEISKTLAIQDRATMLTRVERHSRIHTYRDSSFSLGRLRQTLTFAREHAEFSPQLIEIQGWPDFETVTREEISQLKALAQEFGAQVWLSAHTHRETSHDERGMPDMLRKVEDLLSAVVTLEPEAHRVPLRFVKVKGGSPPDGIHLDYDPSRMILRWR
jgi:hypothetical protein